MDEEGRPADGRSERPVAPGSISIPSSCESSPASCHYSPSSRLPSFAPDPGSSPDRSDQPTIRPADFDLRYRSIGPTRGGRVTTVAGVPGQAGTSTLAPPAEASGRPPITARTGGRSRTAISRPARSARSASHPRSTNVIYVGTGSDGIRSNVILGKGVYRSDDAGTRPGGTSGSGPSARSARSRSTRSNPDVVLRRRDRPAIRPEPRPRCLSHAGRRRHLGEGALRLGQHRRGGPGVRPGRPEHYLRRDVARRSGSRGRSSAAPGRAASGSPPTAAPPGSSLVAAFPPGSSARPTWRSRPPTRTGSTS